ncbi:MAG: hypothetical protein KGS72_20945 [Cyanobacteria bacterium REEB67]|nr:hypothetical protein [Cyanobacteria bacterium REEB67]
MKIAAAQKLIPITFLLASTGSVGICLPGATADSKVVPAEVAAKDNQSKNNQQAKTTAAAVNQIPGVKVAPNELEPPQLPPIKGFHPIKKLLRPVEELGAMSVQIEQQLMKMEGPVAALHPPMINLEKHMTSVNATMEHMQGQVDGVTSQMSGVREDLAGMRKDVNDLKKPILTIQKPLVGVAQPLEKLQVRLRWVLYAIIAATLAVTFGTPIAAMYIYRHKEKLLKTKQASPASDDKTLVATGGK